VFTGIIRSIGHVVSARSADGALELDIDTGGLPTGAWHAGDSVCVAGACLTAVRVEEGRFAVHVSRETLARTTLGSLASGDPVNLEPALAAGDPLGGHYVTGHVDGVARVVATHEDAGSLRLTIEAPLPLARLLAAKGSVTVDGVSLTVNAVAQGVFDVNLVPHTRKATTLGGLAAGRAVNIEVDILARYVDRLLDAQWRQ
jgi:riboflavin synthase